MENFKILVFNPGSTSTKVALFDGEHKIFNETVDHNPSELKAFATIFDQYEVRLKAITQFLAHHEVNLSEIKAVVGRGGYVKPVKSGTYKINEKMLEELRTAVNGEHACNLGGILAGEFSSKLGIPGYISDPTVVDEMSPLAKFTGRPEIKRRSQWHPLNQKACARRVAKSMGKKYEACNFIVAHLGGGITVAAHEKGVGVDVNDGLIGDGPFSLDRPGTLPVIGVMNKCFEEGATFDKVKKLFLGNSGLVAYTGTTDARVVQEEIDKGNEEFRLVFEALAYNISKEIGKCATVLKGKVDRIILTGGLAYNEMLMNWIRERVEFIAPIEILPGGYEMEALAEAAVRIEKGEEEAIDYV